MRDETAWASGYRMPKDIKPVVRELSQVPVWLLPVWALLYWCTIGGFAAVSVLGWTVAPAAGAGVSLVAMFAIARQMRALECLVHEGSHYNWIRRNKRLNDRLVNLLAGWPLLNDVAEYREGHLLHHNHFGSPRDTDLERHAELESHALDRTTWSGFLRGVAVRMPRYWTGWFKAIGTNPRVLAKAVCWHAVVVTGLAVGVDAVWPVVTTWAVFWAATFALVLPVLRMIGELSEHVYGEHALSPGVTAAGDAEAGRTLFDATVTNMGPIHRLLFHPFGDGYHLLHHLYPSVPGCWLGRLHRELMAADPGTYGGDLPNRIRLLERVRRGVYGLRHTVRGNRSRRAHA